MNGQLVDTWRQRARRAADLAEDYRAAGMYTHYGMHESEANAYARCANELEAALKSAPKLPFKRES